MTEISKVFGIRSALVKGSDVTRIDFNDGSVEYWRRGKLIIQVDPKKIVRSSGLQSGDVAKTNQGNVVAIEDYLSRELRVCKPNLQTE